MKKRPFRRPIRWLSATITLLYFRVMRALPLWVARWISSSIVGLAYYFVPRIRRVGLENLDLAYGDTLSRSEKKAILRESVNNVGIMAGEMAHGYLLSTPEGKELYTLEGYEHVDSSKGALLMGAHLGNWEWMCGILGTLEQGAAGVVRPLDDPRLNAYVDRMRTQHGLRTIDKKDAGSTIIKLAREGLLVGLLIDQSARQNGVPVTFFGQPCWATVGPVMLAIRAKIPAHPMSITRDNTGHYTMRILPAIPLEREGTIHEDLIRLTQRCQDAIEEIVRETPGQWLWFHKRWKRHAGQEQEWAARGIDVDFDRQ